MKTIDNMNELESKNLLNEISLLFKIGSAVRDSSTILTNVKNAIRRSDCLYRVENYHSKTIIDDEDGECTESTLNWGQSPDKYIETYKKVLKG